MFRLRISLLVLVGLLIASGLQLSWAAGGREAELIAVLKSDASLKEKSDACRELGQVGTKDCVPTLAGLLGDEKLSHMARYGLEPIDDPAVDAAFRDAIGKLKGRSLVGVIGSIGVRQDVKAVKALAEKLRDSDAQVVQASARALGSIGNDEAAGALQVAMRRARAGDKVSFYEGLFRCAENLTRQGKSKKAVAIYDMLRESDGPHQVRAGAVRGAILSRGSNGVKVLKQYIGDDDYIMFSAAVQTSLEMPGSQVTGVLILALKGLSADNRILVIQALGARGDARALPTLFEFAQRGDSSVRVEAIRSVAEIGGVTAAPGLALMVGDPDGAVAGAAKEALGSVQGDAVDAIVTAMLAGDNVKLQLVGIELAGRRRMVSSIDLLIAAGDGGDEQVRPAAIKMVGELGGPEQLAALLDILMKLDRAEDLAAVEQGLGAVCSKADDPESQCGKLIARMAKASAAQQGVILRVLGGIGGTEALAAVRKEANDFDGQANAAAVTVLCSWKTADAAPDLLALAEKLPEESRKIAALRGYINLVRAEGLSPKEKVAMCKKADALIRREEERKLLLGALGTVQSEEALSMAVAHLDNAAVRNEAGFAAVAIAEKIVEQKPAEVSAAMQKVMSASDNQDVKKRAKGVLEKAKK